jgi:hypothetical protein
LFPLADNGSYLNLKSLLFEPFTEKEDKGVSLFSTPKGCVPGEILSSDENRSIFFYFLASKAAFLSLPRLLACDGMPLVAEELICEIDKLGLEVFGKIYDCAFFPLRLCFLSLSLLLSGVLLADLVGWAL